MHFPYRWLPRTIIPNILWFIGSIKDGIKNIFIWIPVIWSDFDYDWEPLARVMEFKLRRMSDVMKDGPSMGSKKCSRQTLICAELLKRLRADEDIYPISRANVLRHNMRMKGWDDMLGRYMKCLRYWWD